MTIALALFILVNGRILGGLLSPKAGDTGWRIAFLLGMPVAGEELAGHPRA